MQRLSHNACSGTHAGNHISHHASHKAINAVQTISAKRSKAAVLAAAVAFGLVATSASAGTYVGVSAGQSTIEYKRPSGDSFDFDPGELQLDDSDTAFKLFGGYKFTIAAVEAAYVDFGTIENNDDYAEVSGLSVFGMLHMGLGPVGAFAKMGGFVWQSEVSFSRAQEIYEEGDGFDLAYGIGVNAGLLGIKGRLEYEYFNVGDFEDISMISVGVSYDF